MIDDLKKALSASKHPGISGGVSFPGLVRRALPYFFSPSGRAAPPITIYWSINSVCNMRCRMCDVGMQQSESNFFRNLRIDGKKNEISIEAFRSVIDEVARFKPMISITSTEPLLYRHLGEAVSYAVESGLDVAVTTNGYNLKSRAEELAGAGLTRLNVSLDGPRELHNEIRGRKDAYERAIEGIEALKKHAREKSRDIEIVVCYTVTNMNYFCLEEFYDSICYLPVDRVIISYMSFVSEEMARVHNERYGEKYNATINCLNEFTDPGKVDVSVLAEQISRVRSRSEVPVSLLPAYSPAELHSFFHEPMLPMGNRRCMASWFIAEILASGDVVPYARCYYHPLGNISRRPFLEIWNGEKMREWRKDIRRHKRFPACVRCDQVT